MNFFMYFSLPYIIIDQKISQIKILSQLHKGVGNIIAHIFFFAEFPQKMQNSP
jgi:hypothetical protein